jgi:hypothetical protein
MRHEFAWIGGDTDTLADALDFSLQRVEIGRCGDAGPDSVRLFRAERPDPG